MSDPRSDRRRQRIRKARRDAALNAVPERLEERALMAVAEVWTGAVSNLWNVDGNWQDGTKPIAGAALVFPAVASNLTNTNDYTAGTYFSSIAIEGSGYAIGGNRVGLYGPMSATYASGRSEFGAGITISATTTFDVATGGTLALSGVINEADPAGIVKAGGGTLELDAANTYAGTTTVSAGTLQVDGSVAGGVSVSGGTLGGSGTISGSPAAFSGTPTVNPGPVGGTGILTYSNAASLSLASGTTFKVDLDGTTVGSGYDRLALTNSSALFNPNGATLEVDLGFTPSIGNSFQIVSQTYSSPITGRFNGLSQFGSFTSGVATFSIGYFNSGITLTVTNVTLPTFTWDGGDADDALWSSPDNWVGNVAPTEGASLIFPAGAARLSNTNDFAANTNFDDITISGAGYTLSGNVIDLDGDVISTYSSGTSTVSAGLKLQQGRTFNVASGGTLDIAGRITSNTVTEDVTKTGGGTLRFSGSETNLYDDLFVNAGTVALAMSGTASAFASAMTVGDGTTAAAVVLEGDVQMWAGAEVTVNEGSTLDIGGFDADISNLYLRGATVNIDDGGELKLFIAVFSQDAANDATSTITGGGTLGQSGSGLSFNVADDAGADVDLSIDVVVAGGNAVNKLGGGTLRLTQANTYTGATNVDAGVVLVGHDDALGTTVGGTTVAAAASVVFSGSGLAVAEDFQITGGGAGSTPGALGVSSGSAMLTGDVTITGAGVLVGVDAGALLTFSGSIGEAGPGTTLDVRTGVGGQVVLAGSNTFSGRLSSQGDGTLRLVHDNALGAPGVNQTLWAANGTTLGIAGSITIPASKTIELAGSPAAGSPKLVADWGNNVIQGEVYLAEASQDVFVADGGTLTIVGDVSEMIGGDGGGDFTPMGGGFNLTKTGAGTLVLSGDLLYYGDTVVRAGVVQVDGTGGWVALDGGILSGTGSIAGVYAYDNGGTIAPGSAFPGTLSVAGSLSLSDKIALAIGVIDATPGNFGSLDVDGSVDLANAPLSLSINPSYVPAAGDRLVLIDNDGTDAVTGTFAGMPEGSLISVGEDLFLITYAGGADNNDVVLIPVLTYVWSGADSSTREWTSGANWVGGVAPTAYARLVFPNAPVRTESLNNFAAGTVFTSITVAGAGYDIYGNAIDLIDGIDATMTSGTSSFALDVELLADQGITVDGGMLSLSGSLSGAFGVTKSGAGVLQYAGGTSNTYTGVTTVNEGRLLLAKTSGVAVSGDLAIGDGVGTDDEVRLNGSDQIADSSAVTLALGGLLDLFGYNDAIGALTMTGAAVQTGLGTLTLGGDVTSHVSTSVSTISGRLDLGGASRTFSVGSDYQLEINLLVSAAVTGTGAGIVKQGVGALELAGANTYDGVTTIDAGMLYVSHVDALGATSAGTVVGQDAYLVLSFATDSTLAAEPITLSGSLQNVSGANTITSDITLARNAGIFTASPLTITGQITDGAGTFGLDKTGLDRLILASANAYDGPTEIAKGQLVAANDLALGTGAVSINPGAALELVGGVTVANDITAFGPAFSEGAIRSISGANTILGSVHLADANQAVFIAEGAALTLGGALSGSVDFDQNGPGTLVLAGVGTHTGRLNSFDGTMLVDGDYSTSSLAFVDGILGGNGALPGVQISGIGRLAPGSPASPGALATGDVAFSAGAALIVDLNGTEAGSKYDQLDVSGAVDLGDAALVISIGYGATIGDAFTIIDNDCGDAVVGTFLGLAEGATFSVGNVELTISYVGGDGNDVVLTVTSATYTWDGGDADDSLWSSADNWVGDFAPTAGARLVFADGAARLSNTNDFATGTNFGSITIAAAGYTLSGNAIDLDGDLLATYGAGTSTILLDLSLQSSASADVAAGATLALDGAISGTGLGLTKAGGGTLALGGTNTYTGGTAVSAGVLGAAGVGGLGSGAITLGAGTTLAITGGGTLANALTLSGDATLSAAGALTLSGLLSGSATLTKAGTGFVTLTNAGNEAAFTGGLTVSAGAVSVASDDALVGGTVTMGAGTTLAITGAITVDNAIALTGNAAVFTSSLVTLSGLLSGSATLTKTGIGTLTLTNTGNEAAFTGGVSVAGGTLSVADDDALVGGAVAMDTGATLAITGATTIDNAIALAGDATVSNSANVTLSGLLSGSSLLTKSGSGTLTLTNAGNEAAFSGGLTVSTGTVSVASDDALVGGGLTLGAGTTLAITGATDVDNAVALAGDATVSNSAAVTLSGLLSGSSLLTKSGSGTLTLTNTGNEAAFSGGLRGTSGTVAVADDDALVGGTLTFSGAFFSVTGNTTVDNNIVLTVSATPISVPSGVTVTLSGVISETGGSQAINKSSSGTLILTGTNTYTGNTNLNGGTIQVAGDANLGSGTIRFNQSSPTLRVTDAGTIDNTIYLNVPGTISHADNLTLSGVITGTSNLISAGSGMLVLTGTSTATGTMTVSGGWLAVTGDISSFASLAMQSGTVLTGGGTVPALVAQAGSSVSPGTGIGRMTAGGVTLAGSSEYVVELGGTEAGSGYDQLVVDGAVALEGATLGVGLGFAPQIGDSFVIISNDLNDAVTGTFDGLAEGATFDLGPVTFSITYAGGKGGNSVVLTVAMITYVWDGGDADDSLWSSPDNWDGDVAPTPGARLVFPGGASRLASFNDLGDGFDVHSILFSGAGYSISGDSIDLAEGIVATYGSGSVSFAPGITLAADQSVSVAFGGTLSLSGAIAGAGMGLTKAGAGTLVYAGMASNTYNGATTVEAGTLRLERSGVDGSILGDLIVGDNVGAGAAVVVAASNQIANFSEVSVNEGAILAFEAGVSDQIERLTLRGATVDLSAGSSLRSPFGLTSLATTSNVSSVIQGAGSFDPGNILEITVADDADVADDLIIGAVYASGGIDKRGAGTLVLTASNTYASLTQVLAGTIRAEHSSALGTTAGFTVIDGGNVSFAGAGLDVDEAFIIAGSSGDALRVASGSTTLDGAVTMLDNAWLGAADGATLTVNGSIGDGADTYALRLNGDASGRVILAGANTYGGGTVAQGGFLRAAHADAFGDPSSAATVLVGGGATLELAGGIAVPASKSFVLFGLIGGTGPSAKVVNVSGDNAILGDVTLAASQSIEVADGTTLAIAGDVHRSSGTPSLTKAGAGTLVLSGDMPYAGYLAVSAGTMQVDGDYSLGMGVTVGDGATLSGVGSVPMPVVLAGGTVAPGSPIGVLHTGPLNTTSGSVVVFEIDGPVAGCQYDQIVATGGVYLYDARLTLDFGYTPAIGESFTLIDNVSAGAVGGTFDDLPEGAMFTIGAATYTISYVGGDGNDVVLTTTDVVYVWDGGDVDDSFWSSPDNWVGDVAPTPGARLVFPDDGVRRTNYNDLGDGFAVHSIVIAANGYALYGDGIRLAAGIETTYTDGGAGIDIDLAFGSDIQVDLAGGGLVLAGRLLGEGAGIEVNGPGLLALIGPESNVTTHTRIHDGTLVLAKAPGVAAVSGELYVGPGAVAQLYEDNQIDDGTAVILDEGATLDLNGFSDRVGTLKMTGATVEIPVGSALAFVHRVWASESEADLVSRINGPGTLDLNGADSAGIYVDDNPELDVELTIGAVIANGGLALYYGGTTAFTAANTYEGVTYIDSGTLRVEHAGALGAPGNSEDGYTDVYDGGALVLAVPGLVLGEFLYLAGQGIEGSGALWAEADATITGEVALFDDESGSYVRIGAADGVTMTLAGVVSEYDGVMDLEVGNGASGRVVLAGDNTYSGDTAIRSGLLRLAHDNALGDPSSERNLQVENDWASLELSGGVTIPATKSLILAGGPVPGGAKVFNVDGDNALGGRIYLYASQSIDAVAGSSLTLAGGVWGVDEGIGLTKDGLGTLVLEDESSYSGPTQVDAGTLLVDGLLASGGVVVAPGATLGGTGLTPGVTVGAGGSLTPGHGGTGVLTSSGVDLALGALYGVEVGGAEPGSQYDRLDVVGSVNLGGSTLLLDLIDGFVAQDGQTFTIIRNDAVDAVIGTFAGLAEGTVAAFEGQAFRISYVGGDGNDVVLTAVPVQVAPAALPNPAAGSAYSQQLTASGGSGAGYVFSAVGLPAGLSISPSGLISGVPTAAGSGPITFDVTVIDSLGVSAVRSYTISVNPALQAAPTALPNPTAGSVYSRQLTASGGSGAGYVFSAVGLPAGLSISESGLISGTPTAANPTPAQVLVTITDSEGASTQVVYSLAVNPSLAISPATLPTPAAGSAYSRQLTGLGGSGSGYTFSAEGLPAGLSISPSGLISGTPTTPTAEPATVVVTLVDSDGASAQVVYSLAVNPSLQVTPASLPTPTVANAFSQQLAASGGSGVGYVFSAVGLPAGLSISESGLISGVPTAAGAATIVVTLVDDQGAATQRTYAISVNPALAIGPATLASPQPGVPYSQQLAASGGSGVGYVFSAVGLPAGLSISPSGLISGTTTSLAPATVEVTLTDGNGASSRRTYLLNPAAVPSTTTVGSSANPVTFGRPVTLSAAVAPTAAGAPTPTGTVEFYAGTTLLGSAVLGPDGAASLVVSTLPAGSTAITAVYLGDATHAPSTSEALALVVDRAAVSVSASASDASPSFGVPIALTAAISPAVAGAGVSFFDGETLIGTAFTDASGTATLVVDDLAIGEHVITARFGGSGDYLPGDSAPLAVAVRRAETRGGTLNPSLEVAYFGEQVVLTTAFFATSVNGAPMTGMVAFFDGETYLGAAPIQALGNVAAQSVAGSSAIARGLAQLAVDALPTGIRNLRAVYTGDANYAPAAAAAPVDVTVEPATTSTTLSAATSSGVTTLTARVAATSPGDPTLSGTVSFFEGGRLLGTAPVVDGVATLEVAGLPPGSYEFTSNFSGGGTASGSAAAAAASTDGPQIVGLSRLGFHADPTRLVLTFDQPLDPTRAENVANYRVVDARGRAVPVAEATYDPAAGTVTLRMRSRLSVYQAYTLTAVGSGPNGLAGASGVPLDGSGLAQPGTDFTAKVTWRALSTPGRSPAVTFVDGQARQYAGGFQSYLDLILAAGRPKARRRP